jgi:hypothetical protein
MCSKCYKEDVAERKARGEVVLTPEEKAAGVFQLTKRFFLVVRELILTNRRRDVLFCAAAAAAALPQKPAKPLQTDKMKCWCDSGVMYLFCFSPHSFVVV